MTPLHWAVQRGFEECVEALLRYGADVNLENKFGKTPFDIASGINRQDLIELLQVRILIFSYINISFLTILYRSRI